MGKRTQLKTGKTHAKRPRDLWPTIDSKCVAPLLPHLPKGRYAEPMAGDGSLIRLFGDAAVCAWASDIAPQAEGIAQKDVLTAEIGDADFWMSNPPWTRSLLHEIIVHLSDQAPTFLLFDTNWVFTQQAAPFMERCRKIIYVGRMVWIEGTTNGGFQDCAWYEFGRPVAGSAPTMWGHGCLPADKKRRAARICADCGVLIDRFGKWHLQQRHGVPTPVHKNCDRPSGLREDLGTPLLDWRPEPESGDAAA